MIDKGKFEYWLNEEANRKRNTSILADDIYKQIVEFLKTGETKNRNIKKRVDRKDYEIIDFPAIELYDVLCVPVKSKNHGAHTAGPLGNYKREVKVSEMYDIIRSVHCSQSVHNSLLKTCSKINETVANISRVAVKFFIDNCATCSKKQVKRVAPPKPILLNRFMQILQVDLIDMQARPDGEFKYICEIVDHHTEFCVLFPLKDKSSEIIAQNLVSTVFSYFGLPMIIQSDNGLEFVDSLIEALAVSWPGIQAKGITAKSGYFVPQGSLGQTVEAIIIADIIETQRSNWSSWLPRIQYAINRPFVGSTKRSPFEKVFGQKPNEFENVTVTFEDAVSEGHVEDVMEAIVT